MNQSQRKFLIDKIAEKSKKKANELKEQLMKKPNLSNHVYKALMDGKLVMRSSESIMAVMTDMAVGARAGADWLDPDARSSYYGASHQVSNVRIPADKLFEYPESYLEMKRQYEEHNAAINAAIAELQMQVEALETRITLASDKTLQCMINEIDDMGDISLMDTKIKSLNA